MGSRNPKSVLLTKQHSVVPFIVNGQGVFLFEVSGSKKPCSLRLHDATKENGLAIVFNENGILVNYIPSNEPLIDTKNTKGLSKQAGAYYWVSVDAQNQRLLAGIGEARMETVLYQHALSKESKKFLDSLVSIHLANDSPIVPLKFLRDPITGPVSLFVKNTEDLTMDTVSKGTYLPKANLSLVAQKLYDCISGKNFVLNGADFPDFSKAIEYSIATPGCWCNKRLIEKANEFGKSNPDETYLRITLGQNNGESPGIPYVMEIWPVGHYSPVHNHSSANAIIRVLNGTISVALFPFLCCDKEGIEPFGVTNFAKDDITWISPTLNQTHQLTNLKTSKETCITIQCYMYSGDDTAHYEYFDYIDADGKKQQYEPDSDMDFIAFKELMKEEWKSRPRPSWFSRLCCN